MADYAGAVAAIKARLAANWSTTRIVQVNERLTDWPPVDANADPTPWILVEVVGVDANQISIGNPGDCWHVDDGLLHVHVMVPAKSGTEVAFQHAADLGEIFRNQEFYGDTPGHAVRTWTPRVDGGDHVRGMEGVADGSWFRVTMTCPFEYLHLS